MVDSEARQAMRTESERLIGWTMVLVALCGSRFSFAAHPLATEDTGTQGVGNVEFENGLSLARSDGSSTYAYQPPFSYGLLPTVALGLHPSAAVHMRIERDRRRSSSHRLGPM